MSARVFLDTNILVYLYAEKDVYRREKSSGVLDSNYCITSIQALSEASNVWFKKYNWSSEKVRLHLDNIELVCDEVVFVNRTTLNMALLLKAGYGYSYYDCLMLASALGGGCSKIYTEDMKHKQVIEGSLTICNPFTG